MRRLNVIDKKFGRLTVVGEAEPYIDSQGNKRRKVYCVCDCGDKCEHTLNNLRTKNTKSCGCLMVNLSRNRLLKHGYTKNGKINPLYILWKNIKNRCYTKSNARYKDYGGRGIIICDEWKNNPKAFVKWANDHGWKEGLQIDREDNDGNYEPGNCRFVTRSINVINRRIQKSNTSGYVGVSFRKRSKKWESVISLNNKANNIGSFLTVELAVTARNNYIKKNNLPHKIQEIVH